ncbi:MAG: hypothetical protein ABI988_13225 [Nitrospirota bacterium]
MSEDEETKLLEVAAPLLRSIMITALDTGMRRGEMLALRSADVDWKRQLIVLSPTSRKRRNLDGWSTLTDGAVHADPRRFFWVSSASRLR